MVRLVPRIGRLITLAVLVCLIALGASAVAQGATTSFYVSPKGSDRNPGTRARPFRTLARARNAARAVPRPLHADIVVRFLAGTYRLKHALRLRASDSGGNGYNVIYEAAAGAHPLISGGRRITGWTLFNRARGIYRARALGLHTRTGAYVTLRSRGSQRRVSRSTRTLGDRLHATGTPGRRQAQRPPCGL
jgi:hypothetical protein